MAKLDGKLLDLYGNNISAGIIWRTNFTALIQRAKPDKVINQGMARFNRFRLENFKDFPYKKLFVTNFIKTTNFY